MKITRVLSSTPLARQHAFRLASRITRPREIPWERFDRTRYAAEALAIAADSARSLAKGEYGAVTLFSHVTSSLAFAGAPFDLVAAAAQIPADEIRHADYACQMAALCAGSDVARVVLDIDEVILHRRCAPIRGFDDLDIFMLELPAISETLATALLDACRFGATDPVARAFFANIVRDEVHHARLGWYYLAWRAPQWNVAERKRLSDAAGYLVLEIARRFQHGRDAPAGFEAQACALGVLDTPRQRETLADVMNHEIVPGLDALGLGASRAWRSRVPDQDTRGRRPRQTDELHAVGV